jgi:hypothetical protein
MHFDSTHEQDGVENIQDIVDPITGDQLHIVVPEEYRGQYELPKPAHKSIPSWYSDTDMFHNDDKPLDKSVRGCMPFMEALTFGWIIPVPTDISFQYGEDGLEIEWKTEEFKAMGSHPKEQVGGDAFPHDGPIIKFNLPYMLRTPKGVSTLFMPPLNRIETILHPFSGVVDTDKFVQATNIPTLLLDQEFEGVIKAGTPLVQVIPFKRDSLVNESKTRLATESESFLDDHTNRAISSVESFYKEEVWEPKDASRETGGCPFGFGDDE